MFGMMAPNISTDIMSKGFWLKWSTGAMEKAQVSFPVGEGWNVSPPGDDEVIMHLRSSRSGGGFTRAQGGGSGE
jgi:hypothetical protein